MRALQMIGLLLWRGGVLLIGATVLVQFLRVVLRFFQPPVQMEVGLAMIGAGATLVLGSLIAERIRDARREQGLRD